MLAWVAALLVAVRAIVARDAVWDTLATSVRGGGEENDVFAGRRTRCCRLVRKYGPELLFDSKRCSNVVGRREHLVRSVRGSVCAWFVRGCREIIPLEHFAN